MSAPKSTKFPFPPKKMPSVPTSQPNIINIDMSSSGGSETSLDLEPSLEEAPSVGTATSLCSMVSVTASPLFSPATPGEEAGPLNTATLHQSLPDSPGSPVFTTAKSLLATATSSTATCIPSSTSSPSLSSLTSGGPDPSTLASGGPDPGLLASLLQQVSSYSTGPSLPYYYPQLMAQQLSHQAKLAAQLEVQLLTTVESCHSIETPFGMEVRRQIVQELDTLVKQWIRSEGLRQGMGWAKVEQGGGKIVTYGSFKLGVVDRDSDLDLLAVVPKHINREDFFADFYIHLFKKTEVTELRALSKAWVPVIKFKYRNIDVDLTMARLMSCDRISEDEDHLALHSATRELDPRCLRSLNGYRATRELLQLVPDVAKFQTVLRLVKLWARRQGGYGNMLGFLGGASWAILVAKACQLEGEKGGVQDPVVHLIYLFFKVIFFLFRPFAHVLQVFAGWPWPTPVHIKPTGPQPSAAWNPATNLMDRDHVMPIITSSIPQMNSAVNVDAVNLTIIKKRLEEARDICTAVFQGFKTWQDLLQPRLFFAEFNNYIDISARAKKDVCLWYGSVESKLRQLCLMIRRCPMVTQAHVWPYPFPKTAKRLGGFSSQAWYIGIKFKEDQKNTPAMFEEPLHMFTDLCMESARQLSPSHWSALYEMSWELVPRAKLPNHVTETQRKKPSYAAVAQRPDLSLPGPSTKIGGGAAGMTTTSSVLASSASALANFYTSNSTISSLAPSFSPGGMYPASRTPDLPKPYNFAPSMQDGASRKFYPSSNSPALSSYSNSSSRRTSVSTSFSNDARSSPHLTAYPSVTSVPPPAQFSPLGQFSSPPPVHSLPSPCLVCGLPLPGSLGPGARGKLCVCGGPPDHHHLKPPQPRRDQQRTVSLKE